MYSTLPQAETKSPEAEADRRDAEGPEGRPEASAEAGPQFDDEWRRWIAENLLLDKTRESIVEVLVSRGFSPEEAAGEIDRAAQSPYIRGAELLRNRLRKRDWLLATYRKINRLHTRSGQVERRHRLSRGEFLAEYYSTNRPVILTGMMDDWPALGKWSLDYFAQAFGDREIQVQSGRAAGDAAGENYEIARQKYLAKMTMAEFVERVRASGVTNDFYVTANNTGRNREALAELWDDIVEVPEYLDARDRSCYGGFLWMGPPGTVTPFHHDLTNNFMAQVIGRKRVKIAPSWDMPLMANDFHCYSRVDGRTTPACPDPPLDRPQILECILHAGEILFLPIGCMHYVEGLDFSVTVSFTNFAFDNDFSSFYTTYHGV